MDVFLLGSGFSHAISAAMPTMRDLAGPALSFVNDYRPQRSLGAVPLGDLEAWMSQLAEPPPFLSESDALEDKALFLRLADWLWTTLFRAQQAVFSSQESMPEWLEKLVTHWHEHRAEVITLNYDYLVEAALEGLHLGEQPTPLGYYDAYPLAVPFWFHRTGGAFGREARPTLKLYKLHGSLNWFYSGAPEFRGQQIYDSQLAGSWSSLSESWLTLEQLRERVPGQVPLIVPPTSYKSRFFDNELVRAIWQRARRAVEVAETIFMIGYSMPPTDLMVRALVGLGTEGKTVVSINRDVEIRERYQSLCPDLSPTDLIFDGDDALPDFVEYLRVR